MTDIPDEHDAAGIGAPRLRVEDDRLVCGHGRYVDDITLPNMAHAVVVGAQEAHARIRNIDTAAAGAAEGVLLVLTGKDMRADGLGEIPCRGFHPKSVAHLDALPTHPVLAAEYVRHIGDRVAVVVAETREQARDAAELIEFDFESLPPVVDPRDALTADAPQVWESVPANRGFALEMGDAAAVDAAFDQAAHVVSFSNRYPRIAGTPLEPRCAIGDYDPWARRYTLYTATQQPHRIREVLCRDVLGIAEYDMRVVVPDVGGGFGTKGATYPEEAIVVWAAQKLNRPVKWTGDRVDALAADMAGRDHFETAEMAFDADGQILACRLAGIVNLGAYLVYSAGIPSLNVANLACGYDIPAYHGSVTAAFTNTAPVGPYRGTGRPEATFLVERLMDEAAARIGLDRVEIRRRNLIAAAALPSRLAGGTPLQDADFHHMLDRALEIADWNGFPGRRKASEAAGLRRGIGIGFYAVLAGSAVQSERMDVRLDRNGTVLLHAGTQSTGQGHETVYAQMLVDWLGVEFDRIRVVQGDTDRVAFGRGSFAARSMMSGGTALKAAADAIVEKGRQFAALMLDAPAGEIRFEDGLFRAGGSNRSVTLREVAERSYAPMGNPPELGVGLDASGGGLVGPTVPNGCLIFEVEVDPDTGSIRIAGITSTDDIGIVLNPVTATGQIHGAIGQAVGEALVEELRYDPGSGQLLTGSLMDYGLPRADLFSDIVNEFSGIPASTNPLGVKGGSELGSSGVPAALGNAVIDALRPLGVTHIPLPMSPQRVWQAIQAARGQADG